MQQQCQGGEEEEEKLLINNSAQRFTWAINSLMANNCRWTPYNWAHTKNWFLIRKETMVGEYMEWHFCSEKLIERSLSSFRHQTQTNWKRFCEVKLRVIIEWNEQKKLKSLCYFYQNLCEKTVHKCNSTRSCVTWLRHIHRLNAILIQRCGCVRSFYGAPHSHLLRCCLSIH